ncbi:CmcJ/NvfI family oxidoreductase [Leptolyngbya sp. KIOST-1]|uniref:CmcJ/NvfI family oxidoreductase n=1 Tax=Leptolyngbya sp. KIOST-1 TaxID=1229172 RepID=UPI0006892DA4|nr:CmcJ/NvfI family oxidoreductase [Leptolyngbya sp. KIOST-1]
MSTAASVLSQPLALPTVTADLAYLSPRVKKPVFYVTEPPLGVWRDNAEYENHALPIHDARCLPEPLSLDREGFQLVQQPSAVANFYDDDEVQRRYYPEVERLLRGLTGAQAVVVFDHNLRHSFWQRQGRTDQGRSDLQPPVERVHNDFTASSGFSRARLELERLGISATALLRQRFAIVNLWRPIGAPVVRSPLALCHAQTIDPTDLVTRDLVYRDRVGKTYAVTYNPAHQWFYFPQMERHEALAFKCFDSSLSGVARFTAHTAFTDPTTGLTAPPRESIEVRALVFYGA